jgi:hypothetical protein
MDSRIIVVLFFVLVVSGCTTRYVPDDLNERIPDEPGYEKIVYERDGETVDPDQILPESMRPGMEWLKENTPTDAVIMSWWDYGHAIRAFAEREPVVDAPSREALTTTVSKHLGKDPDEIECDGCVPHEKLQEIAELLLTESGARAEEIMNNYGAEYLYVNIEDEAKSFAMFIILEDEQRPLDGTVLGRALTGESIDGFELAYEDAVSTVYALESL